MARGARRGGGEVRKAKLLGYGVCDMDVRRPALVEAVLDRLDNGAEDVLDWKHYRFVLSVWVGKGLSDNLDGFSTAIRDGQRRHCTESEWHSM